MKTGDYILLALMVVFFVGLVAMFPGVDRADLGRWVLEWILAVMGAGILLIIVVLTFWR